MSEQLSLSRLGLLVRYDLVDCYRSYLFVSATMLCIMLLNAVIGAGIGDFGSNLYSSWFAGMLFVWGTIVGSLSFEELHDKAKNTAYLLLPASALEKTLARLVHAVVLFPIFLVIFTTLASFIIEGFAALLFDRSKPPFDPTASLVWTLLPHFIIVQSLFFLGAAWFRRAHWIKTVMSCVLITMAVGAFSYSVGRVLLAPPFTGWPPGFVPGDSFDWPVVVAQIGYFVALPLFCWAVAWLRVKETQVSHGV